VIAVDTNILARFYCDDPGDVEATRQRPVARRVLLDSGPVHVPLTVMLEFEWVMRGFYRAEPAEFCAVAAHLLGMLHVSIERADAVKAALELHAEGFDFADALHWAISQGCERFVTFDDRKLVRRAKRKGLVPEVVLAK
jgi:predicted nucleic-acid-binding protein